MTRVAILWHMHQPFYEDLATGEHILPWVRLHGLKDYYGMAALLREFPDVRVTFNLVPSLLVQLEAFAAGQARDRHLEIGLKPAEALTEEERAFCVEHFFHAHRPTMVDPYPRYEELLARRGATGAGLSAHTQAAQFSIADLRDLQVWHKLAWLDPSYLDGDARVGALIAKGRGFTEADKAALRAIELEILRRIIPEYREAAARGQVELSTSPFYHPILPLLCDTDVYLRTHPSSRMPRERFRRPDDAAEQLARAMELHARVFGEHPAGVWPPEGSVSDDMVPLVAAAGCRWMATDEEILARTIGRPLTRDAAGQIEQPAVLYKPYLVGRPGRQVSCGFRDHVLSDLIGFTYSGWPAAAAADDFARRLADAGRRHAAQSDGREATIFVILDGENAWEHYAGQGRPFLRALYAGLASHPELRTVTMADACAPASDPLPSIFPGSWINGDFYIWIGHADDQRAWGQLAAARRAFDAHAAAVPDDAAARAREELLIAEGSDWFWWYGDDHSSSHDLAFDDLFRRHVGNVYRALEQPIPEELFVTNISTAPRGADISGPTGFIHPTIDGEVSSYFEWIGAGCVEAPAGGAMERAAEREPGIALVEFGFDRESFFVRVDGERPMRALLERDLELSLNFLKPPGMGIVIRIEGSESEVILVNRAGEPAVATGLVVAVREIAELQVPFRCLGAAAGTVIAFVVSLNRGAGETGHHPRHVVEFEVPGRDFTSRMWTA